MNCNRVHFTKVLIGFWTQIKTFYSIYRTLGQRRRQAPAGQDTPNDCELQDLKEDPGQGESGPLGPIVYVDLRRLKKTNPYYTVPKKMDNQHPALGGIDPSVQSVVIDLTKSPTKKEEPDHEWPAFNMITFEPLDLGGYLVAVTVRQILPLLVSSSNHPFPHPPPNATGSTPTRKNSTSPGPRPTQRPTEMKGSFRPRPDATTSPRTSTTPTPRWT